MTKLLSLFLVLLLLPVGLLVSCSEFSETVPDETVSETEKDSETEEVDQETETDREATETVKGDPETVTETESETEQLFELIFQNEDGSELWRTTVLDGAEVVYGGEEPQKDEDEQYTYRFSGWDHDFSMVTQDMIITACFEQIPKNNIADDGNEWGDITWF